MSRAKGARGERAIANIMKKYWPNARRGVGQTRMGSDGADVEGTPFWVEVKYGKSPRIQAAIDQANEATDGRPVIVCSKKDKCDILVTMKLSLFLKICIKGMWKNG